MGFVLLLGQKMDCLGEVEINGMPVAMPKEKPVLPPMVIEGVNVADGVKESSVKPKGSGKGGKLTEKQILDEYAKAAGFTDVDALKKHIKDNNLGANKRTKADGRWRYSQNEAKYGKVADCTSILKLIADEYGLSYKKITTQKMHKGSSPYEWNKIPAGEDGKPDFSKVPTGALLYKPGHVGLYIGDNREISPKTNTGNEHTNSAGLDYMQKYEEWAYIPFVDYSSTDIRIHSSGRPTK